MAERAGITFVQATDATADSAEVGGGGSSAAAGSAAREAEATGSNAAGGMAASAAVEAAMEELAGAAGVAAAEMEEEMAMANTAEATATAPRRRILSETGAAPPSAAKRVASAAKGGGKGGKAGGKGKNEKEDDVEVQKLLVAMLPMKAKAILMNYQLAADLASAILQTYFIRKESTIAKAIKAEMQAYGEITTGSPKHDLGVPHVHCLLGFVRGAIALLAGISHAEDPLLIDLTEYLKYIEEADDSQVSEAVPFMRLKRIQKPGVWLLQHRSTGTPHVLLRQVFDLQQAQAQHRPGRQPTHQIMRILGGALEGKDLRKQLRANQSGGDDE